MHRHPVVCLPGLGVLPGWDDDMRNAQRNAFMTVLRVVRTVTIDAGNALVSRNLAQQRWQDRCVADTVIGHFHGPDLERKRIDPEMHLAPLAAMFCPVLLRLPLAFTQHIDASAVHQQVQARRGRHSDSHLQRLFPPADRAVVWPDCNTYALYAGRA